MRYYVCEKGFPLIIKIYYENTKIDIGIIEVYPTGKIYFKDNFINAGMSIKQIKKILKIAKKEIRKEKIAQWRWK